MLGFVDTTIEETFQDRHGVPDLNYGWQVASDIKPLTFQYESSEAISSFVAKRVDNLGDVINTVTLNTNLIQLVDGNHYCDGNTSYDTFFDCGLYYFVVNDRYQSDYFLNIETINKGVGFDIVEDTLIVYDE